jgi:hypothetical protein
VRVCSPIKMSIEKIDSPTPPQKSPILCKMRLSTGRLLAKRTRLTDVHPSTRGNSTPSEVEMWQGSCSLCPSKSPGRWLKREHFRNTLNVRDSPQKCKVDSKLQ